MPLADKTAVANLALDLIGEPYLTDLDTDTGVTAECVRLHFPQALETLLEGHVWSFATRCSQLTTAIIEATTAGLVVDYVGLENALTFQAKTVGPSGNNLSVRTYPAVIGTAVSVAVTGQDITIQPFVTPAFLDTNFVGTNNDFRFTQVTPEVIPTIEIGAGALFEPSSVTVDGTAISIVLQQNFGQVYMTADTVKQMIEASAEAMALVSVDFAPGNDGTGIMSQGEGGDPFEYLAPTSLAGGGVGSTALQVRNALQASAAFNALATVDLVAGDDGSGPTSTTEKTYFSGGSSGSGPFVPAYGSAFNLPPDCLRLVKIDGEDIACPRRDFEIQGRYLLLEEAEAAAPVIHYITNEPPVTEWPTTFTDAVAALLASRIAPKLSQNPQLAQTMAGAHELALGKARSKDARETRSAENFGPRQLSARSGLVRARFGGSPGLSLNPPPES